MNFTCAKEQTEQALKENKNTKIIKLTKKAIQCANLCIQKTKKIGCYYYRAVSRGLLIEAKGEQPKRGLPKVISDFKYVADHEPKYDLGAAFEGLAEIYLKMPRMPIWGDESLVQNLKRAQIYVRTALLFDENNAKRLLLAGTIAYKLDDLKLAKLYFSKGKSLARKSKDDVLYKKFKNLLKKVKKKKK